MRLAARSWRKEGPDAGWGGSETGFPLLALGKQIQIPLLGIRETLEPDDLPDQAEPAASYVFEYFDSEVELEDCAGRRHYGGNVCILFSPGYKKSYRASERLTRTWFHVQGDGLEACLERYCVPLNRAMPGAFETLALIPFLEDARRHNVQREPYWEDAVTLLCRTFFRNLSRVISHVAEIEQTSLYQKETLATLRHLRAHVHLNLDHRWTIAEMAPLAHLSPSHFRKLFANYFSVSPIEDLIHARIRQAKLLLRNSTLPINEIAERCGFSGTSQFHVCFRKRTGRSPGEFIRVERIVSDEGASRRPSGDRALVDNLSLLYLEPIGYWNFDGDEGGIDQDYHFRYDRLAFNHGAVVGTGPHGQGALALDGVLAHAETAEPIVDTAKSFTVCAWTLIEEYGTPGEWMTAISVGNENHGSFYLQCCVRDGCYMFTVTPSGTDFNTAHVRGTLKPERGKWVHLTGVHDLDRHTIALWENGELSGTLSYETPWRAPGPTRFGAAVFWGMLADFWVGRIAEIRFYDRALSAGEIKTIYNHSRGK